MMSTNLTFNFRVC